MMPFVGIDNMHSSREESRRSLFGTPLTRGTNAMIDGIHHIGIAVHNLDDARVILSDDHTAALINMVSRRNLGWARPPRAGSRVCSRNIVRSAV